MQRNEVSTHEALRARADEVSSLMPDLDTFSASADLHLAELNAVLDSIVAELKLQTRILFFGFSTTVSLQLVILAKVLTL